MPHTATTPEALLAGAARGLVNPAAGAASAAAISAAIASHLLMPDLPPAARAVFKLLDRLEHGVLELVLPDGRHTTFGQGAGPHATIRIDDWAVCAATLKAGDIGFAESYIAGHWRSPDLAALLHLFVVNREQIESAIYGSRWGSVLHRIRHLFNRNSRAGSRRNIHAHYDLGNAFYTRWLDETMNYSSAWFDGRFEQPLAAAQKAKVWRALDEVGVNPGDRVLEIGCGWGAVAEAVARDTGAHLTGVTLSTEQLAYAQARLADAGLAGRADLRLQDYRDIADAPFDGIVSIEMFEAVGRQYWPVYFETVQRCLKPGGRACIQSITIRDDLFERYVRSTDFIQQYIFPGGLLPSVLEFSRAAERAGLVVERTCAFGRDYAETLRRWRASFMAQDTAVRALGFDTRFIRTWEFYLAYCEAAFDAGSTDVVQFTLRRA
jgi:cyclopropane-fatty-acyl-phospholipid synthase